jgi:fibronectin-binding autotransporter adhesin
LGANGAGITLRGGELLTTTNGFRTARAVDVAEGKGVNTLAAETGTTATYTGVFSDIGALTVGDGFNDGKVVLASGANTYFGGTTVLRGATLSVNTDAELGNTNGGIILRFGGELLTTANFTSARSVSLNPLSAPNFIVTPLAPVSRNILAAAANTTATYTGLVFGNRGLAVGEVSGNNPGVVVLANLANSYTGGTLVQGGATLSVANDTNLGDPTGGIILATGELLTTASGFSMARAVDVSPTAGRNILAAANGTTATYTGVLSDGGTLVVGDGTHAGTVLLAGTNTYSGGTVIDLGTLIVDNAQALGTGNVTVNGGVLAADPQPINVLGDYTQNAGGTLQLNVAGRAIGQFDVLNVTGNAALNGTLRLINQGYQPQSGDKLRLVTTGGAVSGRFAQFQNPFALAVGFNTIDLVCVMTSTKSHPRV